MNKCTNNEPFLHPIQTTRGRGNHTKWVSKNEKILDYSEKVSKNDDVMHPINQSINRSIRSQSINQLIDQKPINQSIDRSEANQSINQLTKSQSINQSIDQKPINQSIEWSRVNQSINRNRRAGVSVTKNGAVEGNLTGPARATPISDSMRFRIGNKRLRHHSWVRSVKFAAFYWTSD